jgi:hypothetical protein
MLRFAACCRRHFLRQLREQQQAVKLMDESATEVRSACLNHTVSIHLLVDCWGKDQCEHTHLTARNPSCKFAIDCWMPAGPFRTSCITSIICIDCGAVLA